MKKKLIFNKLQYKFKRNKNIFIFIYYIYVEILSCTLFYWIYYIYVPFPIGCILPQAAPNSLSFFIKSNNDLTAVG